MIIPTRNRWRMLATALGSVARQELVETETIVVDDASSDSTPDRLVDREDVQVVRLPERRGVTAARNAGLAEATCEWVAFLDDDDQWAPSKLRHQLAATKGSEAGFAYSGVVVVHGTLPVWLDPAPATVGLERRLLGRNVIPAGSSNVLARTEWVREHGGFDEQFDQIADWDLWIRLAGDGPAESIDEISVAYVAHRGTMSSLAGSDGLRGEVQLLRQKHRRRGATLGATFDELAFDRWIAISQRRQGRRLRAASTYLGVAARHRSIGDVARAGGALLGERALRLKREAPELPGWVDLR